MKSPATVRRKHIDGFQHLLIVGRVWLNCKKCGGHQCGVGFDLVDFLGDSVLKLTCFYPTTVYLLNGIRCPGHEVCESVITVYDNDDDMINVSVFPVDPVELAALASAE
eukprot:3302225-Heterocapsa_arctica.AAC.1